MNYDLPKIRIKCAETLGYRNVREPVGPSGQIGTWWGDRKDGEFNTAHQIPNYPVSADAALELVAWMAKPENGGWNYHLQSIKSGHYFEFIGKTRDYEAISDTLPLAVCLAFLKANGIDPETL